jgi:hypothetical protein
LAGRVVQALAAFFLYAATYFALRLLPNQAYAGSFNTACQAIVDLTCMATALAAARRSTGTWRQFFVFLAFASGFLLLANFGWGLVINVWALNPNETWESLGYRIPYLFCLAAWMASWLRLVSGQVRGKASAALIGTALLVGLAISALLVQYYGDLILDRESTNPHRVFVFLYVSLEIATLILCVGLAIIELHPYPVLIAIGYALMVATDFVFNTDELQATVVQNSLVEIPWTAAQACVALGIALQRFALSGDSGRVPARSSAYAHFAVPILVLTLGAGVTGGLIASLVHPQTVAIASSLFAIAASAIGISMLARANGRACDASLNALRRLVTRGAAAEATPAEAPRLVGPLTFGSFEWLGQAHSIVADAKTGLLPLGPDQMFPVAYAWSPERPRHVFIAMPYAPDWANGVSAWLRSVIRALGWTTSRADELFETRDVLDGVWKGMCESQIVVAELTGRNPNVLYEVGLAHCLGKPVVLLCQRAEDVPFDLMTRRVVFYDVSRTEEATARLSEALRGCV